MGRGVPGRLQSRATGRLPSRRPALSLDLFVRYRDLAGQLVELYRHDEIVLVQTFDPASFAGHRLPAGFLTSAAEAGASVFKMMEVSRHKSLDTLRGYVRRVDLFKDHAGAGFL